ADPRRADADRAAAAVGARAAAAVQRLGRRVAPLGAGGGGRLARAVEQRVGDRGSRSLVSRAARRISRAAARGGGGRDRAAVDDGGVSRAAGALGARRGAGAALAGAADR